jgi:hypothetical protein
MTIRRVVYAQADYLSRKSYFVHIYELPDGKRREVLRVAAEQIAEAKII